jgi:Glycosyltransferase
MKQVGYAPSKVQVWILSPFRELFDNKASSKIKSLQQRCPNISIKIIGGIGRLKDFPQVLGAIIARTSLGSTPAIYHCRGELAAQFAVALKKYFPNDRVVLDVRGYWPAEMLYKRGIQMPEHAVGKDIADYNTAVGVLSSIISKVDAVTTVSAELRALLINKINAPEDTTVVPCCVKHISDDRDRVMVRKELGFADGDIVVVYSGTATAYQHLEDLTLPFLYELSKRHKAIRVLIMSPDIDVVKNMLAEYDFSHPVVLKNVPQAEVAKYLSAADAGILLRKPTLVNTVANPVKIAEYLASGLSIIAEEGVGGIPQFAINDQVIIQTTLAEEGSMVKNLIKVDAWLNGGAYKNRNAAREVARKYYDWNTSVDIHRATYSRLLKT